MNLNPLTSLIAVFRAAASASRFLARPGPSGPRQHPLFLVGLVYFRRVEDTFADII